MIRTRWLIMLSTLVGLIAAEALSAAGPLAVLDDKPLLQVDPGGPSAAVTALAFGPDGKVLYSAGLDKVVRVWTWQGDRFALKRTIRVPIGPGTGGAINAMAVSPDGDWLAVAGRAPMRGETGFQRTGLIVENAAFRPEQLEDVGVIYLINTANPTGGKVLRGHRGEVRALSFAPGQSGKPPLLVSTASEREGTKQFGGLRLWNVETGKLLAQRNDLPSTVEPPPGLAVWHTGARPEQVRVAIAWLPEEPAKAKTYFRLWDPSANSESLQGWEADAFTQPVALVSHDGSAEVLTGGASSYGRLQSWRLSADPKTKVEFGPEVAFPKRIDDNFKPLALTVLSALGDGAPSHAAVILQPTTHPDDLLAIIDLAKKQEVASIPLPKSDQKHLPLLAATPRGSFLAVADSADHSVKVFAIADLLRGETDPAQILVSNGLMARHVAFVNKGRGLWLTDDATAKPLSGGMHFDFDNGQLSLNKEGELVSDTPSLGDWSVTVDRDQKTVRVRAGDKSFPPIVLGKKEVVTKVALRRPGPLGPGLLAVAYTDRDNALTRIMLCRPEDGIPFRILIGHVQDVTDLAFSAGRPLLASVAEDQTVCVWSLTDLDNGVGQVPGLRVTDRDGKAVVDFVEKESAAAKAGLAKEDVLEAVSAPGGELRPIGTALDFYFAVGSRRPGDRMEVKIQGKRDPVTLTVGRGADGGKPLFSLFLLRGREGPEWIGWSPAGPYDASSDAAEACVGWHRNTGDPASPVEFVRAGEYRDDYYRHGILGLLAEEADLGRALKKDEARRIPPEPALQIRRPQNATVTKQDDVFLIREGVPALRVGINADYPIADSHVLRWTVRRVDGGNVTEARSEASGTGKRDGIAWQVDLSEIKWRRGEYQVQVSLCPSVQAKSVADSSLTLRFQPLAPTLSLRLDGKDVATTEQAPQKITDDKMTLEIALSAGPEQQVNMAFGQWVNGKEQAAPPALRTKSGKVSQTFNLGKGVNRLAVRAVNDGALAGHEAEETTSAVVWVRYDVPNELPPRFTTLRLDRTPETKQIDKKDVWVVDRPRVRLDGRIEADGALVEAGWSARAGDPTSVLPVRGAGKALDFHIDLDLKAGEVFPLRLRAKSKNSEANTADLAIVFQPPLPVLAVDALKGPDFFEPKAMLTGTFRAATADPFGVVLRVTPEQGSPKEFKEFAAELDREKQVWKANVSLLPGRNRVEAFVRTKWRGEEAVDAVKLMLRYRRLPHIVEAKEVTAVETAVVDLPLVVESPAGMPVRAITIEGHRVLSFKAVAGDEKDGLVTWQIRVPQVPVCDDGRKLEQLHVLAHNDDGPYEKESLVKETVVAVTHKTIPKAADARFLLPKEVNERRSKCIIPYRVDSDSPLISVEVHRGEEVLYRADLTKVRKESERYVLDEKPELALNVGLNNLNLVAINAGGRSAGAVVVNVAPPSVRVTVDRIELRSDKGDLEKSLKPLSVSGDELKFPEIPRSLVWVVGRVSWSDPEAKQLDSRDLNVLVLVRGCRQFPVALEPRGQGNDADVRRFEAPVVLTDANNSIKIEVKETRPDGDKTVGQQVLSRSAFNLACSAPQTKQRLHLLIVGVDVPDADKAALTKRVLDTLGVKDLPPGLQGEFKTDAFDRSILYRVLTGEVERGKVEAQLVEINEQISQLRHESKWLNDVVLVYYQGEDAVKKGERWLKTSRNRRYADLDVEMFAIPCRALPCAAGSQLLLLNVAGAPEARVQGPGWGGDPDVGLLRYAWSDIPKGQNGDLLQPLKTALREKSRLGDVVGYLNGLLSQLPVKPSPLVVLDKDQAERKLSLPR